MSVWSSWTGQWSTLVRLTEIRVETLNCSLLAEGRIVPGLFVLFAIVYWTYGNILFLYY